MGARMASPVKSRPNHYQTLGLSPSASDRDIAAAFARAMNVFGARSLTSAAQIGTAFEVLRNPEKRRDHDRALGLASEPRPYQWPITPRTPRTAGFMGSAWSNLAQQVAAEEAPSPPVAKPDLRTRLENGAEPKIASFIASSLREPAHPRISELIAKPAEAQRKESDADEALEQHIAHLLAVRNANPAPSMDDDVRTVEWKRPALALGGLAVAAGLIGTLGGLWVQGGSDDATQPQAAAPAPIREPQANSVTVALPSAGAPQPVSQPPIQRRTPAQPKAEVASVQVTAPPQPIAPAEAIGTQSKIAPTSDQVQASSQEVASDAPAPVAAEAKMPLPNGTIARTIEKIGYSCGTVASVASMEKAGIFKVTCSSGQSYQATPVHGRYHFRKMGGR